MFGRKQANIIYSIYLSIWFTVFYYFRKSFTKKFWILYTITTNMPYIESFSSPHLLGEPTSKVIVTKRPNQTASLFVPNSQFIYSSDSCTWSQGMRMFTFHSSSLISLAPLQAAILWHRLSNNVFAWLQDTPLTTDFNESQCYKK